MRNIWLIAMCTALCLAFFPASATAQEQVHSQGSVTYGDYAQLNWVGATRSFGSVPTGKRLIITDATFSYFPSPSGDGVLGRVDFAGREGGTAVFRNQVIYVEPKKNVHLSFPSGLILNEEGYAEIGFVAEGPGTIFVSVQAQLINMPKKP